MDTKHVVSNERWFMVCPSGHLDETGPRAVAASRWLVQACASLPDDSNRAMVRQQRERERCLFDGDAN